MERFEQLLQQRFPDRKLNEEVIMDIRGINGGKATAGSSLGDMSFAQGNAQVKDFFEIVGLISESSMDDLNIQYMPYEKAALLIKDADYKAENTIAYKVHDRRHTEGFSYKPRESAQIVDDDERRIVTRYTEHFTTEVDFYFMSTNYDQAWEMMDRFEDTMISYSSYIRAAGITEFYFQNQLDYIPEIDFREIMIIFVIRYIVKTERNRVITKESVKNIDVYGKVVHEGMPPKPYTNKDLNNK
jgi:hypothetical protein